jgi:lysophospholipase L1-like esterase
MKFVLAALALLFSFNSYGADGIIVMGDSLSAQQTSWPEVLRYNTGRHVQVMAQNGRTIRDFTIPNDLHADRNINVVMYLLGGNDAFQSTPGSIIKERVRTHLRFLRDRGFRVIVIKVPPFPFSVDEVKRINSLIVPIARSLKLEIIDPSPIWNTVPTYDTVHPTPEGSEILAEYIQRFL